MILEKVISGGQTGADRAGLIAAKAMGISTGGWMPHGFLAYDGKHPEFAELYGLTETISKRYPPRTSMNVLHSDGTLRFATNWHSPGELLTLKLCNKYRKPNLAVTLGGDVTPVDVMRCLVENNIRVLNVAGNSERTSPGIEEYVRHFLENVFQMILLSAPAA